MNKLKETQEGWDFKKILIGLVVVGLLIFGLYKLKTLVLDKNSTNLGFKASQSVQGISTDATPNPTDSPTDNVSLPSVSNIQSSVTQKIQDIKSEAGKISITDIASSSPQVQKVINDINSLQSYPTNQAKDICQKICSGL